MKELADSLKSILQKLSDFFDILDLSFFVSGFTALLGIYIWLYSNSEQINIPIESNILRGLFIVLLCYTAGLVCFALGRWVRDRVNYVRNLILRKKDNERSFDEKLVSIIHGFGLEDNVIFKDYITRHKTLKEKDNRSMWMLYVRLWAELRHNKDFIDSLGFMKRTWVMAAVYDGITISSVVWFCVLLDLHYGYIFQSQISLRALIISEVVVFFSFYGAIREANRFVDVQMHDLIATIATQKQKL
jgi:hypothetical protein